jgi:hypothetical protein
VLAYSPEEGAGQCRQLLQRMGQHGKGKAHRLQGLEAVVGDHRGDGHQGEEREPGER